MVSTTARAQALAQILQLCRGDADARTLRLEVLAVLRRVIGFDAYVWVVTDPETSVGCAPLADVPCLPELPTGWTPPSRSPNATSPSASRPPHPADLARPRPRDLVPSTAVPG